MPRKPDVVTLSANTPQILNAIRNDLGGTYADLVPLAEDTTSSIRAIGQVVMNYESVKNAFVNALINRIAFTLVTSRLYENPWSWAKKGLLEYGETVQEVFASLCDPELFNPRDASKNPFKRYDPNVQSAYHSMNYQVYYPKTISNDELRQAFLSWNGITDLVTKMIETMYTSANYDELITMKYLIARMYLDGNIHIETIPEVNADNAKQIVTAIKSISTKFLFLSTEYNYAGVPNASDRQRQYAIFSADFDATIDVEVQASAFNLDKVEFLGHRAGIDSFAFNATELARLDKLFANNVTYKKIGSNENTLLQSLPCVILDRDFFMFFDNYYNITYIYDPVNLSFNYFYHNWKTASISPFANVVAFSSTTNSVSGVTVSPTSVSVDKGQQATFTATVAGSGVVSQAVTWSVNGVDSSINEAGVLSVGAGETTASLTVTATSKQDTSKSGTATVTVPQT